MCPGCGKVVMVPVPKDFIDKFLDAHDNQMRKLNFREQSDISESHNL
jgi:rRNA maturation protein Nop10